MHKVLKTLRLTSIYKEDAQITILFYCELHQGIPSMMNLIATSYQHIFYDRDTELACYNLTST